MQTALADFIKDTPEGREADAILRSLRALRLLHGDLPDLPAAGRRARRPARAHLPHQAGARRRRGDRERRSCTSTAASPAAAARRPVRRASQYGRLLDIGRARRRRSACARPPPEQATRWALRRGRCWRSRCSAARWRWGGRSRPLLPAELATQGARRGARGRLARAAARAQDASLLDGCVQPSLAPEHRRGDGARPRPRRHLAGARRRAAAAAARCRTISTPARRRACSRSRNIDAWWPHVERGAEAIVVTASGCGVMVKDYGHLLRAIPRTRRRPRASPRSRRTRSRWSPREWPQDRAAGRDGPRRRRRSPSIRRARCSTG